MSLESLTAATQHREAQGPGASCALQYTPGGAVRATISPPRADVSSGGTGGILPGGRVHNLLVGLHPDTL